MCVKYIYIYIILFIRKSFVRVYTAAFPANIITAAAKRILAVKVASDNTRKTRIYSIRPLGPKLASVIALYGDAWLPVVPK